MSLEYPTNADRAARAIATMKAYATQGARELPKNEFDPMEHLADLLADLFHAAKYTSPDEAEEEGEAVLQSALNHYRAELEEETHEPRD